MKTRIKQSLAILSTRDEAEAVMRAVAQTVNKQKHLASRRDAEVLEINKHFEARIAALAEEVAQLSDQLRHWSEANPDQFPKDRKSITMTSGTLGFRTGTPKLALLSRAWNWDKVLLAVQQHLPNFIRSKPEVDKEAILGQREELAPFLPSVGLKVTQDGSFYIEPDLTEIEQRQTA